MNNAINIFDRKLKQLHRDRAANLISNSDFLVRESAKRLAENLGETITKKFPTALDIGSRDGSVDEHLKNVGIENLFLCDSSFKMLSKARGVVADEEALPFKENSFDLITSVLNLHWVNDLPGCLININKLLKKDGFFIASILGGESLKELRKAIMEAEMATSGGFSPRISPFVEVKDAGSLLQRAGFNMPVTNSETITVLYGDVFSLIKDLRGMGETNALIERNKSFFSREKWQEVDKKYHKLFGSEGKIPASFEIITLSGWKN